MTAPAVVVVGAINVDLVVAAARLPGPGETVVGGGVQRHGGGKGANAAVAAARAGADVRLVGAVGADDTGAAALAELRADGVDTSGVAVLSGVPTGVALIVVDDHGENQIAVGAGANAAVTAEHVRDALRAVLPRAGCVLVSTEIGAAAVAAAVESASAAGVRCVLNPAPVVPVVAQLLAHGPVLTPNATECRHLAALVDADSPPEGIAPRGARALVARTGAPVAVTLGGDGAVVLGPGEDPHHVPPLTATVRDTTGAGDTFNGVLAAGLAAGDDIRTAVRAGTVAASLSVAHVGARTGMPRAAAIAAALPVG
ncbi:PfkB family carbohydrate kinase [Pseudonocardia sp.]|uniref:PfkB family carbohydrate kinase n=1 Tax=Pseudonocardia sp. TaxID=60912 RepID=UPI0026374501|nr:PfkB family carbohydrate kinase [Pseudonocardia sp.]